MVIDFENLFRVLIVVAQSCQTLCDPMDYCTPGFPVLHHLPELVQTHVHWVSDAIRPSRPLLSPSPAFSLSQLQGLFQWAGSCGWSGQSIRVSALASVLPMNSQDWFLLGLTGLILQSKGLSRVFSNTTVQIISSLTFSLLYGPTLTSIHDYWKNHSLLVIYIFRSFGLSNWIVCFYCWV